MRPDDAAREKLFQAYCDFAGRDLEDVREDFMVRRELINNEWHDMEASDWVERATRFYKESKYYVLELLCSGPTAEFAEDKLFAMGLGSWVESDLKSEILEVGGGLGFAAEAFAGRGHEVTCVEVEGDGRDFAEWRLRQARVNVRWLSPEELRDEDRKYDLVFSDAVMEHLVDPCGVAAMLCKRVKLGGAMHLSIDIINRGREWPMRRWVDLSEMDESVVAAGGVLKFRSPNLVSSHWEVPADGAVGNPSGEGE